MRVNEKIPAEMFLSIPGRIERSEPLLDDQKSPYSGGFPPIFAGTSDP